MPSLGFSPDTWLALAWTGHASTKFGPWVTSQPKTWLMTPKDLWRNWWLRTSLKNCSSRMPLNSHSRVNTPTGIDCSARRGNCSADDQEVIDQVESLALSWLIQTVALRQNTHSLPFSCPWNSSLIGWRRRNHSSSMDSPRWFQCIDHELPRCPCPSSYPVVSSSACSWSRMLPGLRTSWVSFWMPLCWSWNVSFWT